MAPTIRELVRQQQEDVVRELISVLYNESKPDDKFLLATHASVRSRAAEIVDVYSTSGERVQLWDTYSVYALKYAAIENRRKYMKRAAKDCREFVQWVESIDREEGMTVFDSLIDTIRAAAFEWSSSETRSALIGHVTARFADGRASDPLTATLIDALHIAAECMKTFPELSSPSDVYEAEELKAVERLAGVVYEACGVVLEDISGSRTASVATKTAVTAKLNAAADLLDKLTAEKENKAARNASSSSLSSSSLSSGSRASIMGGSRSRHLHGASGGFEIPCLRRSDPTRVEEKDEDAVVGEVLASVVESTAQEQEQEQEQAADEAKEPAVKTEQVVQEEQEPEPEEEQEEEPAGVLLLPAAEEKEKEEEEEDDDEDDDEDGGEMYDLDEDDEEEWDEDGEEDGEEDDEMYVFEDEISNARVFGGRSSRSVAHQAPLRPIRGPMKRAPPAGSRPPSPIQTRRRHHHH